MIYLRIKTSLLLLFLCFSTLVQGQTSYIQIISEPDISIYLDNILKGVTNSGDGGLIIENVSAGNHTIKAVRKGFNEQKDEIFVKAGEVFIYKVKPFAPKIKISQQGSTGGQEITMMVGTIKIQSLPFDISIAIPELNVNEKKKQDVFLMESVPVGSYQVVFSRGDKNLKYTIPVENNQTTHLFVNILKGVVENRSPGITGSRYTNSRVIDRLIVNTARAYFHSSPDAGTRRKGYCISRDAVDVLEEQGSWVFVRFTGPSSTTTGWMKKSDLTAN